MNSLSKLLLVAGIGLVLTGSASAVYVEFNEVILPTITLLDGTTHYDPWGIGFADFTYYAVDTRFSGSDDYGITNTSGPNNLITVLFHTPVTSVWFDWLTIWSSDIYAAAYAPDNVTIVDSWSLTGLSGPVNTGAMALGGGAISRVTWWDGDGEIGIGALDYNPIPEPSTLALLGLGLVGIGLRFVRRR